MTEINLTLALIEVFNHKVNKMGTDRIEPTVLNSTFIRTWLYGFHNIVRQCCIQQAPGNYT